MAHHKVLIVVGHYCPLIGGAQSVYDAMARQYPDNISVLTSRRDYETGEHVEGADAFDQSAPYPIYRLDRMRPNAVLKPLGPVGKVRNAFQSLHTQRAIVRKIIELTQANNIDTIVVGASDAMSWLPATLKRLSDFRDIRILYYTHGEEVSQKAASAIIERRRHEAVRESDHIIAVSRFTADMLTERYGAPNDKITLVYNGVDYASFAKDADAVKSEETSTKRVVAVGRLVERKGFADLLRVWPKVLEAHSDAKLTVIGDGPERSVLDQIIVELDLSNSVQVTGAIDQGSLIKELHAADLFVMPNRTMDDGDTEGFGLVFLEAAAAGLASVGGNYGGASDAIIDGETGLLVDAKSDDELVSAITSLLSDEKRRNALALNASKHALHNGWHAKAREFMLAVAGVHGSNSKNKPA